MLPLLLPILGSLFGKVADVVGTKLGVDMTSDDLKSKRLEIELELQKIAAEGGTFLPKSTGGPITQKATGILALVKAGLLAKGMAHVAVNVEQALQAYNALSGPVFVRPCPEVPRHGFVDSRVCKSAEEVRGVFLEARKADPKAELILMPYIDAAYNMVWTPGLLAVGPGHDGATAGKACLSLTVGNTLPSTLATVTKNAKIDTETGAPYMEAVSSLTHNLVITQLRGGPKGAPTGQDWNPYPMYLVTDVILAEGDLLEWESTAKTLGITVDTSGSTATGPVVYHPGGNLGSHYAVHARINNVPVYVSTEPKAGQFLPQIGTKLVPLDPDAIVWGFLGGALAPNLLPATNRGRAVACALSGAHHGLSMGGSSGVGLGVSVAMMLRLGQAALWGEARHKEHKGLAREQVYASVLNNWLLGRSKLGEKTTLFHDPSWKAGFGGKAWAACGHATIDLDTAMLTLIADPSEANAKDIVVKLNTVINLAHNNGWWMNKFGGSTELFDLGAAGDPRPLLQAAPIWYEASVLDAKYRMDLLDEVQTLAPVTVDHTPPSKGKKIVKPKAVAEIGNEGKGQVYGSAVTPGAVEGHTGKIGSFGTASMGGTIALPAPMVGNVLAKQSHVQIMTTHGYVSGEIIGLTPDSGVWQDSYSGSGVQYQTVDWSLVTANSASLKQGGQVIVGLTW